MSSETLPPSHPSWPAKHEWRSWVVRQGGQLVPVSDVSLGDIIDDVTPRWIGNCFQGSNAFLLFLLLLLELLWTWQMEPNLWRAWALHDCSDLRLVSQMTHSILLNGTLFLGFFFIFSKMRALVFPELRFCTRGPKSQKLRWPKSRSSFSEENATDHVKIRRELQLPHS